MRQNENFMEAGSGVHTIQQTDHRFEFKDISVTIDKKDILKDINGFAKTGEMLAVMGPSGSGKTTLLNCLAGRRELKSGKITLNSQPLNKQLRRQISYVLQNDTFLPELTCWQTLWYTAQLRLPESLSKEEKKLVVDYVVDMLDIRKCLNTKIGTLVGLSGGEKKRTSIACELLTDPTLMLLDEPTSGLDSSTALSLVTRLKEFAKKSGKTVIMTIHQPSSQIFHMFDKLLLMCDGQMAYFGDMENCSKFFSDLNLSCPPNYNIADHILYQINGEEESKQKILQAAKNMSSEIWQPSKSKYSPADLFICSEKTDDNYNISDVQNNSQVSVKPVWDDYDNYRKLYPILELPREESEKSISSSLYKLDSYKSDKCKQRWPTGFWIQFTTLTHRSLRQTLPSVVRKEQLIQTLIAATFGGLLWFRTAPEEGNLRDRQGLMFFTATFASFNALLGTLGTVPVEKPVVDKERLAGYYRLSAYFFSKVCSLSPITLVVPLLLFSIIYWLSGMNYSFLVYLQMAGMIAMAAITGQAVGLFYGLVFSDYSMALTGGATTAQIAMLAGGFLVRDMPFWASWMKNISFMTMIYYGMLEIDITNTPIKCSPTSSQFQSCWNNTNLNSTQYISQKELLDSLTFRADGWFIYHYLLVLLLLISALLLVSYITLRVRKPCKS